MSGRFVRASKYRHVFGRQSKRDACYDNLRISRNAWDTNLIKVNPSYAAVNWEASGGGAFAVIPLNERGKAPEQLPLFRGHTSAVLDTDWSPFNDSFLASASDDGKVFLWKVPDGFSLYQEPDAIQDVQPVSKLAGHGRKVGHVLFNPAAEGILASASGDYSVKLWDVEEGSAKLSLKHSDMIQSLAWKADGSLLVTTCRDKKLRIWDVRQERPALETAGHSGGKNSRVVWLGDKDRIATTGFSKMSDRQLGLWDTRSGREPINDFQVLDQISGVCMPFFDEGTQCLFLAGKGDGNIRYYEFENDKFEYLAQHTAADPQRGIAFLPKRGVNTHENEVVRAYRTVNDSLIEPVSFIVPRRAEAFQDDIFPPTVGTKPGLGASRWLAGETALPPRISLESLHDGQPAKEIPSDYKPPTSNNSQPTTPLKPVSEPQTKPTSTETSAVPRGGASIPSVKDNQASISSAADKFNDKDDDEGSEAETSSFEEVSKPIERPVTSAAKDDITFATTPTKTTPKDTPEPAPESEIKLENGSASAVAPVKRAGIDIKEPTSPPSTATHRSVPSASGSAVSAADNLKSHLRDIKELLESQHKTILAQSEKLDALTREVQELKTSQRSL